MFDLVGLASKAQPADGFVVEPSCATLQAQRPPGCKGQVWRVSSLVPVFAVRSYCFDPATGGFGGYILTVDCSLELIDYWQ